MNLAFVVFALNQQTDDAWRWLLGDDRVVLAILLVATLALGALGVAIAKAWKQARPFAYGVLASVLALVALALGWLCLADGLRGAIPG